MNFAKSESEPNPFIVGLRAARANLWPGLIVQVCMFALVACYYTEPAARDAIGRLAAVKNANGYLFSMMVGIAAGAVLPEIFSIAVFQKWKIRRENLHNLRFTVIYWGIDGMVVDALYRLQGVLFGDAASGGTVLWKVLFDQFVMTPFFFLPLSVLCYEWKHRDYKFSAMSGVLSVRFLKQRGIPALITCWAIWIPLLFAIYALPPLLQIPMFALALTIWVMLFTYITRQGRAVVA